MRRGIQAWAWRWEVPTWGLVLVIYGGWLALTYWWRAVPPWVLAPAGAWLCAWQMSLQHEIIHGHPTRNPRINALLGAPPLNLWLPYTIYRDEHLRHHHDENLTDPLEDPESTYMSAAAWHRAGPVHQVVHRAGNTLTGRLLLGPAQTIAGFWLRQIRAAAQNPLVWRLWAGHAFGVAIVLAWVCGVCGMNPLVYAACFLYPGTALSMIRSLAEHRAAEHACDRTAVVERAGLLGVLFLHNNLHVLHHLRPAIPWFELPSRWRASSADLLRTRQGPIYDGYLDVARRYALRPHHPGPHPGIGLRVLS